MQIKALDDAIARYETVEKLPKGSLMALTELREHINGFSEPSDLGKNIHEVHIEVGGMIGGFSIHFQLTVDFANKWRYELCDLLSKMIGVTFRRVGSYYLTTHWRNGIEIVLN
ncbi:MAG: hypothetical protein Q8Q05_03425 [bacterium]|nr:hypothetical protein [bacterium]